MRRFNMTDITKFDAIDYLFFAGFDLAPIEPIVPIEEPWFWAESGENRQCIIEQMLAEALVKVLQ